MPRFRFAAAALAAAAFVPNVAAAEGPRSFRAALVDAIERQMDLPMGLARSGAGGVAAVAFAVGADGRTAGVRLVESSGDRSIDRAALRTVTRLELPADAPAGPHLAVLQYGSGVGLADDSRHGARLDSAARRGRLALHRLGRETAGCTTTRRTID